MCIRFAIGMLISFTILAPSWGGAPPNTAFTYQGQLKAGGAPFGGAADLLFRLFRDVSGGSALTPPILKAAVPVENGLFAVELDFGVQVFDGQMLFLEVLVRPGGSGVFTTLSPRQPLTPTPYAIRALVDETFGLPFEATVDFDDTLFSLTKRSLAGDFAAAIRGAVTNHGTGVSGVALGRGTAGAFESFDPTNPLTTLTTSSNGPGAAFFAGNFGTGPAAEFQITGQTNASATLAAKTSGVGPAGAFDALNANSNAPALDVFSLGQAPAILSTAEGSGGAALFEINEDFAAGVAGVPTNTSTVLEATTNALGRAGHFRIREPSSQAAAIEASTAGLGSAGIFINTNPGSGAALQTLTNGQGPGLFAQSLGGGAAGVFRIEIPTNTATALEATTLGQGNAAFVRVADDESSAAALKAVHAGVNAGPAAHLMSGGTDPAVLPIKATLRAVQLRDRDGGSAGQFISLGPSNDDPALFAGALGRGSAGEFLIQNLEADLTGRNEADALKAMTFGFGRAGLFEILSTPPVNNTKPVLEARTNGGGPAGLFSIVNPVDGLSANDAPALQGRTVGLGSAARFEIDRLAGGTGKDPVNNSPAVHATTNATGNAARFESTSTEPVNPTLEVNSAGRGIVGRFASNNSANSAATIVAETQGTGPVAQFTNFNSANGSAVLSVSTNAVGTAGAAVFQNTNANNSADVVAALANNTHHALFARQSGPGEAAHFEIADPGNGNNAVFIRNNGIGAALKIQNQNTNFAALALGVLGKSAFNGQVDILGPTGGPVPVNITGPVSVSGDLCATSVCATVKNFRIDHPLDPENKYLYHASIESSEMKNMYDGSVVLDENGQATVALPKWFEALNESFRYQLTAIGGPAPNLHIAREIGNGEFQIAGGPPQSKVSWQVTGVRRDAYARANPLRVEMDKPENERGKNLFWAACGPSAEKIIHSVANGEQVVPTEVSEGMPR